MSGDPPVDPTGPGHDVAMNDAAVNGRDVDPAAFDVGDGDEVVRFTVVDHGAARVLTVAGEIDTLTAPALRTHLDEHLGEVDLLVLDLSEVTFLGSAGLAVLVTAKDEADRLRRRFRLVPGSRIVVRALEATGLLTLFDLADTASEALAT